MYMALPGISISTVTLIAVFSTDYRMLMVE